MEEAEKANDERLINLIERARVRKLKLHPEKIKFKLKTVPYVGHKLQADESKVTAIKQFPAPTNVHEVRRFLGMVNFFSRFVPNLSAILEPLYDLTKKDSAWLWEVYQENAMKRVKKTNSTTVAVF